MALCTYRERLLYRFFIVIIGEESRFPLSTGLNNRHGLRPQTIYYLYQQALTHEVEDAHSTQFAHPPERAHKGRGHSLAAHTAAFEST